MQIIENDIVKEKLYIKKLQNGLTVMVIPKKGVQKKFIIYGTKYGSNDSKFVIPGETAETTVPDGVAHFLEHKMFEQENGTNSLDVLTSLGVNANAYTTNDHTAYLFEATENFDEALNELMNYVQNPYFTNENVEKEKGIIEQEIRMYDDLPEWNVYINLLKALYKNNSVNIDITGTKETINKIDKEILYKCYNTFYNPSNMAIVISGDFKPEEIIKKIEDRLLNKENNGEIKRIYKEEPLEIVTDYIEENMAISTPLFMIGIKDTEPKEDVIKRNIAIDILLKIIIGKSSELFINLYKEGLLQNELECSYEFANDYAYILMQGQSKDPKKLLELLKREIKNLKEKGIAEEDFERIRKMTYANYIKEYNGVDSISTMFLANFFKGINSFEYLEEYTAVTKEYAEQVLKEVFDEGKMSISVIKSK